MTDPNLPPERVVVQPEPRTTVNVQPEKSGGGGFIAFLVGGLIVVVAIIAFVLYNGGAGAPEAADTNVDVDVNLPSLPEAPKMPQIEPPTLPAPGPAPAN